MTDEIPPLDESHSGIPPFQPEQAEEQSGLIDRIKALFPFLKKQETKDLSLRGRVNKDLQQNAHKLLHQLQILRQEVKVKWHEDRSLWTSFEAVVRPLFREFAQLERKLDKKNSSPQHFKAVTKNYQEWLEKAKLWVAFAAHPHDKEGLAQAVVEHTQHLSDCMIDRDLQMLEEYMIHELQALGIAEESVVRVGRKIHQDISVHLQGLAALKQHQPQKWDLEELMEWKGRVNTERAMHYNEALHLIDATIQSIS